MNTQKKKTLSPVLIGAVVVILILGAVLAGRLTGNEKKGPVPTSARQEEEQVIPTVDAGTTAELKPLVGSKEMKLSVAGIPTGTESVEYQLSYATKQQGLQGVMGVVSITDGKTSFEKQITLGTCSSGKCVYHEVEGAIKVSLKFSGSYGDKLLEKNVEL